MILSKYPEYENKVIEFGLEVRYLKSYSCFEFRGFRISKDLFEKEIGLKLDEIGEGKSRYVLRVSYDVVMKLLSFNDIYKWSIGYKCRVLEDNPNVLEENELSYVGKSELDLDTYRDLCVYMFLFNISKTKLDRTGSGWVNVRVRSNRSGRKKGSLNLRSHFDSERLTHNINVALKKHDLYMYLESNREMCKMRGDTFNREKFLKQFEKLTNNM